MKNEYEQLANENESFRKLREVIESGNREAIEDFHRQGQDEMIGRAAAEDSDPAREAWKAKAKQAHADDPHG